MRRSGVWVAILIGLLWPAAPARAAIITFDSATVNQGETFEVEIGIAGAIDLFSFSLDLVYDPAVVSVIGVTEGPFLGAPDDPANPPKTTFFFPVDLLTPGAIGPILNTLVGADPGATGDGVLAIVRFMALLTGAGQMPTGIAITSATILDSGGNETPACVGGDDVPCLRIANGAIDVAQSTAVPEPASLALFGLGLFAFARRLR